MEPDYIKDNSTNESEKESLADFFSPVINPDDIIPLWEIKQKTATLNALVGLFKGSQDSVMVRLLVLSEMIARTDTPTWTLNALRHVLSYLSDSGFHKIISRLKDCGIIKYNRENNTYAITSLGVKVHGIITEMFKGETEDSIGILTGLLYAGEITGTPLKDKLEHCIYRLLQIENDIYNSIESASESRIIKARDNFQSIWKYLEKGTEIIKEILDSPTLESESYRAAQQVGYAQSRLAKQAGVFQKALNDIDRQRVHLGKYGISTSDLNNYLMSLSIGQMESLLHGVFGIPIAAVFVLSDELVSDAEYEFYDRERLSVEPWELPPQTESPMAEAAIKEDYTALNELITDIDACKTDIKASDIIPSENYEKSAYRLSLLSLIGNKGETSKEAAIKKLVSLSVKLFFLNEEEPVGRLGIKSMSKGTISAGTDENKR